MNSSSNGNGACPYGTEVTPGFDETQVEQHISAFFREFDNKLLSELQNSSNVVTIVLPLDGGAGMGMELFLRSTVINDPEYFDRINIISAAKDGKGGYIVEMDAITTNTPGKILILDEIADKLGACKDICKFLYEYTYQIKPEARFNVQALQSQLNVELWCVFKKESTSTQAFNGNKPVSVGDSWIYSVLMDSSLFGAEITRSERMSGVMLQRDIGLYGPINPHEYQKYLEAHSMYRYMPEVQRELSLLFRSLSQVSSCEEKFQIMREFIDKKRLVEMEI